MKAKVKRTGEIVDVTIDSANPLMYKDLRQTVNIAYYYNEIEFVDESNNNNNTPQNETTIKGWVCCDSTGDLLLSQGKPSIETFDDGSLAGCSDWYSPDGFLRIERDDSFPSITWESEPVEVELTIKIKEK